MIIPKTAPINPLPKAVAAEENPSSRVLPKEEINMDAQKPKRPVNNTNNIDFMLIKQVANFIQFNHSIPKETSHKETILGYFRQSWVISGNHGLFQASSPEIKGFFKESRVTSFMLNRPFIPSLREALLIKNSLAIVVRFSVFGKRI